MLQERSLDLLIPLDHFPIASNTYKSDLKKFNFWWVEILVEYAQALSRDIFWCNRENYHTVIVMWDDDVSQQSLIEVKQI